MCTSDPHLHLVLAVRPLDRLSHEHHKSHIRNLKKNYETRSVLINITYKANGKRFSMLKKHRFFFLKYNACVLERALIVFLASYNRLFEYIYILEEYIYYNKTEYNIQYIRNVLT